MEAEPDRGWVEAVGISEPDERAPRRGPVRPLLCALGVALLALAWWLFSVADHLKDELYKALGMIGALALTVSGCLVVILGMGASTKRGRAHRDTLDEVLDAEDR